MTQLALFEIANPPMGPDQIGRATVSEILAKQILTKANGSMRDYDYSLNPYVGCGFACTYCFASFFQPEQERFDSWGQWIDIKSNAGELLKNEAVERLVVVESADDVIAVAPDVRLGSVALVAIGLGIANEVEPVPRPPLAVG